MQAVGQTAGTVYFACVCLEEGGDVGVKIRR